MRRSSRCDSLHLEGLMVMMPMHLQLSQGTAAAQASLAAQEGSAGDSSRASYQGAFPCDRVEVSNASTSSGSSTESQSRVRQRKGERQMKTRAGGEDERGDLGQG